MCRLSGGPAAEDRRRGNLVELRCPFWHNWAGHIIARAIGSKCIIEVSSRKGTKKSETTCICVCVRARMPETWFAHLATEDRRAAANLPTHPSLIAKRYARQNPIHCWHQIAATQIPVWHVAAVGSLRIRESHRPRHVLPQGGDEPQLRACLSQWAQSINHSQYSDPGPSRVWGYIACCNHQIFR